MMNMRIVLLLASGWALPDGKAAASVDDGTMRTCALSQTPVHQFEYSTTSSTFGKNCRPVELNITVAGAILNIHEGQRQVYDTNIFYELEVFWKEDDNVKSKREELPLIRDYVMPVSNQCSIYWMRVCRQDRQSSECVCDTWIPPHAEFGEVQVLEYGVVDKSYVVAWNVSNQECVRQYKVEQSSKVVTTAVSYAKLVGLKACGRYRLRLSALYRNGDRIKKSVEISPYLTTKSVIAGALGCAVEFTVQELKVEPGMYLINPADFTISSTDQNLTNAVVCTVSNLSSYLVPCESTNQTTFAAISDAFSIRKLSAILGSKIDNKVSTVIPSYCPALSTAISGDVTIKPPSVGPVRDLRANTDIDRSVILTWRPPIEGTKCVKEYLVTWASESRIIDSSNTSYNVTNLEPCTTYEFTVNAIDHTNDKGTPESITATVRELQQLSAVTELELNEVEPRSFSVKWKPPLNGTNCVESYRVVAWYNEPETGTAMEVFSNTTADQHVTFGEVIACMVYTVQVIPIWISKKDGLNDIGSLKTKERTILSYHVDPIRAVTVKSRSLELSTLLHSENNNNCLLVSVRFNCTMMKEGEPVPGTQVWKDFVIPSSNISFEGIVEPLVPYSMYQCNAQIQNIAGLSDPTPFYEFQTAEDVPESPGGVELVGQNRSINITWKAPSVKNGVVVRYRIHVRMITPEYPLPKLIALVEEINETVDLRDEVNPNDAVTRSWDGVEFQHSVGNLNPYTMYTVQVAAATGAGFGTYTEPEEVVTLPDVSNVTASFSVLQHGPTNATVVLLLVLMLVVTFFVVIAVCIILKYLCTLTKRQESFYSNRNQNSNYTTTTEFSCKSLEQLDLPVQMSWKWNEPFSDEMAKRHGWEDMDDGWEFPRCRLKMMSPLGDGAFGQVWRCEATGIDRHEDVSVTAVKKLQENATQSHRHHLLSELEVLKSLDQHDNVVRLLGCCTKEHPILVILEFINMGKLLTFLKKSRTERNYENTPGVTSKLTPGQLSSFMLQVACGMDFLSSNGIIHRDLAARNILVTDRLTCKIANFGFARDIASCKMYERRNEGRLPIRWMAIESLYGNIFTFKTDVWSFGVLMWEIVTLGSMPYVGIGAADVMRVVRDGYRMGRPAQCRRELHHVMLHCWAHDPNDRPSFSEVVQTLDWWTNAESNPQCDEDGFTQVEATEV